MSETRVVIDWSDIFSPQKGEVNIDGLIDWIRTYPRQKDVHVYLRPARHNTQSRLLQNSLKALGCTVTNKVGVPA